MRLPKDKDSVKFRKGLFNKIVSICIYDCGCEWETVWEDITKGKVVEFSSIIFCEEHDPTVKENGKLIGE